MNYLIVQYVMIMRRLLNLDKVEESLNFISEDFGIFNIISKHQGVIGNILYKDEIKKWVFFPKNNYFYMPVTLALILGKLNMLNGYKKEIKK